MLSSKFEWDSEKKRLIAEKHGLTMEMIKGIFDDEYRLERYDKIHSRLEEDRWQTVGMVNDVLFAVYTERGEKIRIITAREATPGEKEIYHGTSSKGGWYHP